jgi:hypothetical protein
MRLTSRPNAAAYGSEEALDPPVSLRPIAAATVAAMLVCSLPFWTGPWLGMIDYPNHLGRYFILAHHDELPALQTFYQVRWSLIPDIGSDVVILAVHRATGLPTETVSQVLVGLFSVLLIPAVLCLNRALFGAWSCWPLASALLVFNHVLLYGFVNYIGGLTLAFFLAAAWVALHDRPVAILMPAFAVGATMLFFFHFYAFAVYGLFFLCHEAWSLWVDRSSRSALLRRMALSLQFLPALLILTMLSPTSRNITFSRIGLSTPEAKLLGLYSIFDIGIPAISIVTFLVFGAAVLAGLLTRRLVFSPTGASAMVGMMAIFLVMPFELLGSGFADYRLPLAIAAVAIAATRWRALPKRVALILSVALVTLVALRVVAMTFEWRHDNQRYAEIIRVMSRMETGRKLLSVIAEEDVTERFLHHPPLDNVAGLAVIVRQAFVPTMFAEPEKQPIVFRPAVAPLVQYIPPIVRLYDPAEDPLSAAATDDYDYVLVFARTPWHRDTPAHLTRIDDGTAADLLLFAVHRPAGG